MDPAAQGNELSLSLLKGASKEMVYRANPSEEYANELKLTVGGKKE